METHIEATVNNPDAATLQRPYEKIPLTQLVRAVVQRRDRLALRELHQYRKVFRLRSGRCVLLAEFLLDLKDRDLTFQWCGRDPVVVDQVYDLTLAKFHDLPSPSSEGRTVAPSQGPDCRHYFRAFGEHITREFERRPPKNAIDAEIRAADALQRLVTRHFYLSCLECSRRAAKLVRRYMWKVNGGQLVLWLPVEMSGSHCRRWLQENVPDADPARPGEPDRVQAIIDRRLARRRILSLDQLQERGVHPGTETIAAPETWAEEVSTTGLADVVAEEKAENIDEQRPSIRSLGASRLRELIRAVFESLTEDRYHAERMAAEFGLSKATFSRFAGCNWRQEGDNAATNHPPDLLRNTAHVLASHEDFVALAREAGVWGRVREVILDVDSEKGATK